MIDQSVRTHTDLYTRLGRRAPGLVASGGGEPDHPRPPQTVFTEATETTDEGFYARLLGGATP